MAQNTSARCTNCPSAYRIFGLSERKAVTGTPTFLVNLLKSRGEYEVGAQHVDSSVFDTVELDRLKLSAILYQTCYLTITAADASGLLRLDYPNKEVRDSMLKHLLAAFTGVGTEHGMALEGCATLSGG